MNAELSQNQSRIQHLNEVKEQKDLDIVNIAAKIQKEQNLIVQYHYQLDQLVQEIKYFETQNHKHQQNQQQLSKASEYEYFRGKDLQAVENDLKMKLKQREEDINALRYEIEQLKQSNQKYIEDSQELHTEIEALNKHMALLNQQNFELSKELEKFIETDEIVRRSLNRKGKVEDIRHKVDEAIQKSMYEVQTRRSPERNQRESPLRRSKY